MTDGGFSQFSPVGFAVAVVTVGVGTAAGLAFVPTVGSYLGMLLGAFVAGLAVEDRPLLEAGIAGVLATLGILVAGSLIGNGILAALSALGSVAPTTLLTSAVLSFAVGAFGAHFGDDLRHGLAEPVETPASGSTTPGAAGPLTDESSTREIRDESGSPGAETGSPSEDEPTSQGSESSQPDDAELEYE